MTFEDLNLNRSLLNALEEMGLEKPTTIQSKVFAPIMSGKDIVGIAQTGTGKTYAYLLPVLRLWKFTSSPFPQILILVPTRELVVQVVEEAKKLTTYMTVQIAGVYGGSNIKPQIEEVMAGVDIVVGTPGRMLDLMHKGALKTKNVKRLIIDEVDEMLHQGFRVQLNNIITYLPRKRQNLMFSATMTEEVEEIIHLYTDYYERLEAAPSGAPLENINQTAIKAQNFNTKANLLTLLLRENTAMTKVLIFAGTKKMADVLYQRLQEDFEENIGLIHSSRSQNNRFDTVKSFEDGSYRALIATDIIARGLDISDVSHVINFNLPESPENYIHRIGRTGRADQAGMAISFVSEAEMTYKESIEELMGMDIPWKEAPEDLVVSEELIELEKADTRVPFDYNKMKQHTPSGEAFHEKSEKNKKENIKTSYESELKKKYKKQYRKKDQR